MDTSNGKNNRLFLWLIISVSIVGNIYFGYRVLSGDSNSTQGNPFEYNIESFKKIDSKLLHYSEIHQIPLCFQNVSGIAIDAKDNIYVTGDENVLIMNKEGKVQASIATDETALCLDVDKNSDVYLGMIDHIEVFEGGGAKKAQWKSPGGRALITSIAVSDDYVFAADAGNHVVRKYDKNGNDLLKIGEKDENRDIPGCVVPGHFFDIGIDPDGFLWIVNPGRHSLENYTFNGDLRSSWGEYSIEIKGFCGCCNPSHIIILDDGKFVTSEKGIVRIKVYDRAGNLESVVAGPDRFIEGTEGLDLAKDSNGNIYVLDPMKKSVRVFKKNTR